MTTASPAVALPPPGPALTLHEAAAKLRTAAQAALEDLRTDSFWSCYEPATAWRDGFVNGMGGEPGDLAELLSPGVALELAEWLDATARRAVQHAAGNHEAELCDGYPIVVARRILEAS